MALRIYIGSLTSGTEVTDRVRLGDVPGFEQRAWLGEASICDIRVDDPDGDFEVDGFTPLYAIEDTAPVGDQRIATYYIDKREVNRERPSFEVEEQRLYTITLVDINTSSTFRVFRTGGTDALSGANRPAETNIQRIDWLLGTPALDWVHDFGLIDRSDPRPMEATSYFSMRAADVLNDCASAKFGYNWWIRWNQTEEAMELFFGAVDSTADTSNLRLSNVRTDVDNVDTFYVEKQERLERDPQDVYDAVLVKYANEQSLYLRRQETSDEFDIHRDGVYDNQRIGLTSTATSLGNQWLAKHSAEEDTIYATVELPAALVNEIRQGMRIEVRFRHFPGYEDFTFVRVVTRNVRQSRTTHAYYQIDLELTKSAPGVAGGGGGAPETPWIPCPPPEEPEEPTHLYEATIPVHGDSTTQAAGTVLLDNDTTYRYRWTWTDDGHLYSRDLALSSDFVFPLGSSSNVAWFVHYALVDGPTSGFAEGTFTTPDSAHFDASQPVAFMAGAAAAPHDTDEHGTATLWIDPDVDEEEEPEPEPDDCPPPLPGQPVAPLEVPVGDCGDLDRVAPFPYVPGTLRVGVRVGDTVTPVVIEETDPATGAYRLLVSPCRISQAQAFMTVVADGVRMLAFADGQPIRVAAAAEDVSLVLEFVAASSEPDPQAPPAEPPVPPAGGYPADRSAIEVVSQSGDTAPALGSTIVDSVWGTTIRRIGTGKRHDYARRQPWSKGDTLIWLPYGNVIIDASTLATVQSGLVSDHLWANTQTDIAYGGSGTSNVFQKVNGRTGATIWSKSFSGFSALRSGDGEGRQSADDRYVCLNEGGDLIVVDIAALNAGSSGDGAIVASKTLGYTPNNVTMAVSGRYVLINGVGNGVHAWDWDADTTRELTDFGQHGDVVWDAAGNDWYVQSDQRVKAWRMSDGLERSLFNVDTVYDQSHVSGTSIDRPGWVYLSVYDGTATGYGQNQVLGVKLDGSGAVEVFAHDHHADNGGTYEKQPQAAASRDGRKVMFASDWGGGTYNCFVAYQG